MQGDQTSEQTWHVRALAVTTTMVLQDGSARSRTSKAMFFSTLPIWCPEVVFFSCFGKCASAFSSLSGTVPGTVPGGKTLHQLPVSTHFF